MSKYIKIIKTNKQFLLYKVTIEQKFVALKELTINYQVHSFFVCNFSIRTSEVLIKDFF